MRALAAGGLAACLLLSMTTLSAADDVAPGLAEDAVCDDASNELAALVASLDEADRRKLQGIYVAVDPTVTDVAALPGCDDDGDYVVVLSRAMLELVEHVAYADASDRIRGTHVLDAYGPLLARAQRLDTRTLPPPPPAAGDQASHAPLGPYPRAFVQDALAWLVADEVARAVRGDVTCPHPTSTREHGDDVWTADERAQALLLAPARMTRGAESDAWATLVVLGQGRSLLPAVTLLRVLAPLEEARPPGGASTYLTLHPRTAERIDTVLHAATAWQGTRPPAGDSSPARTRMR
jgi:hypothetical protein